MPLAHIVDDDEAIRDALTWLFRTRQVACRAWESAEAFLEAWQPDWRGCIVLDIRMREMSGLECFEALREQGNSLPVIFLTGLCFAALGLIMTALAPSYDFFMYYFTLVITPMTLLSGVFFPQGQLPDAVRTVAECLPLSHAVALVRPLLLGELPGQIGLHLAVLAGITVAAFWLALALTRRRLLK